MKEGERGRKRGRNEEKNKRRKIWRKAKSVEGWTRRRK